MYIPSTRLAEQIISDVWYEKTSEYYMNWVTQYRPNTVPFTSKMCSQYAAKCVKSKYEGNFDFLITDDTLKMIFSSEEDYLLFILRHGGQNG